MMENIIGVNTVDSGSPKSSKCTPDIVLCELQKNKKHEGIYNKKAEQFKKSSRNITNSDASTVKLATNELEVL